MGVGDQDMRDGLPNCCDQNCIEMRVKVGAGVDHSNTIRADKVGVRPAFGHGRGIGGDQASDVIAQIDDGVFRLASHIEQS